MIDFMTDLRQRFINWKSWCLQEWRDDSEGESIQEFDERMNANAADLEQNPYDWVDILENFTDDDF